MRLHPFDDARAVLADHLGDPITRGDLPPALDRADLARLARLRQTLDAVAPKKVRVEGRPDAIRHAADNFAAAYDASFGAIEKVAKAIEAGTLLVRDREIASTPRDLDLEQAAETVRGLLVWARMLFPARAAQSGS